VLAAVSISTRLAGWRAVVAGHGGQVAVEYHDVVPRVVQVREGVGAVEHHVHGQALPAQPGRDRPRQDLEVLHHQHPHDPHDASPAVSERCQRPPGDEDRCRPGVIERHRADTDRSVEPTTMTDDTTVEVDGLRKRFGSTVALDGMT
jgi:hypothetical protein